MRPSDLRAIPLAEALGAGLNYVTMSTGQWDNLLAAAYDAGWILLELDGNERPVRAYQKPEADTAQRRTS
jgi:hypothetical protein